MPLRIGTSGWQYDDWRDVLYPPGVPQRAWFEAYAHEFDTVEVNAAFYRLPELETFECWRTSVPACFTMALKASRYLTHVRRLQDPQEPVERLMAAARGRAAARVLVGRRGRGRAARARRGAVLGRPRQPAHHAPVAHGVVGLPAAAPRPDGVGLRPHGTALLARTARERPHPGRGRLRLPQQRPGRGSGP